MSQIAQQSPSPWWKAWRSWLLAALAAQYIILQLATGVEYLDAQRNMQWGIYLLEQPSFLIGAENVYDRINGFPPSPATLAPAGRVTQAGGPLSPWWGPLYLLLFAGIWWLTGSYTALQSVAPLAAGAVVLLTYAFGKRFFGPHVGLVAAVLLALFPTYREHAALALVEPFSALLLIGAFWAVLDRRAWLAALLGTLAMLGKPDMVVLYFGTIGVTALLSWRDPARPFALHDLLIYLVLPLIAIAPWFYLVYVVNARPTTVSGGPSLGIFLVIAPLMLDQFFTLQPFVTLLTLGVLIGAAGLALWHRQGTQPVVYRLLAAWLALGCMVMFGYAALPSASNNPRVLIPALPALCLLVADGLVRLRPRWRQITFGYLLVLFLLVNSVGVLYQVLQARALKESMPVWEALRIEPRGYVLTEQYWNAALYARQPATWFENDTRFQHNIMQNLDHFRGYIASAPIRYIVLPRDEQAGAAYMHTPLAKMYNSLPLGRELGWTTEPLTAPEVRNFLDQQFPQRVIGDFVIFTLDGR